MLTQQEIESFGSQIDSLWAEMTNADYVFSETSIGNLRSILIRQRESLTVEETTHEDVTRVLNWVNTELENRELKETGNGNSNPSNVTFQSIGNVPENLSELAALDRTGEKTVLIIDGVGVRNQEFQEFKNEVLDGFEPTLPDTVSELGSLQKGADKTVLLISDDAVSQQPFSEFKAEVLDGFTPTFNFDPLNIQTKGLYANGFGSTVLQAVKMDAWAITGTATASALSYPGLAGKKFLKYPKVTYRSTTRVSMRSTRYTVWCGDASDSIGVKGSWLFSISDPFAGIQKFTRFLAGYTSTESASIQDIAPTTHLYCAIIGQSETLPNPMNYYVIVNGSGSTPYTFDTGIPLRNENGMILEIHFKPNSRIIGFLLKDIETGDIFTHDVDLDTLTASQQPSGIAHSCRIWRSSYAGNNCGFSFSAFEEVFGK